MRFASHSRPFFARSKRDTMALIPATILTGSDFVEAGKHLIG
jgi:hypothetical protein